MAFELPALPYDKNALAPHLTAETLEFHHGKHHNAYVVNLNKLLDGKPEASKSLEEIIMSSDGGVFNNAAQIWNHTFYWNSMKPNGGGAPTGDLAAAIDRDFVYIHDPDIKPERDETDTDKTYVPIDRAAFSRMARFGQSSTRATLLIGARRRRRAERSA